MPSPGFCLEAAHARPHELGHLRLLELERERARVDLRELEEIVDKPSERANLLAHGREVVLGGDDPVLDRLEHRLQRGERRPQVVARPRDQLSACVEELLELSRHLVEGEADLDELVGPRARRHRREVASRERRGAARRRSSGIVIERVTRSAAPTATSEDAPATARTTTSAPMWNIATPGEQNGRER